MGLDQSRWKFVVTAMDGSTPFGAGEVPKPNNRTFSDQLNTGRTAGFNIKSDNPRASFIMNNDCLGKLYRMDRTGAWKLMIFGDIIQTEEDGDGNGVTIGVTINDPFFRLGKRLVGLQIDSNGQGTGWLIGSPTTPIDLSIAVEQAVQFVNADFYCGIDIGAIANCGTNGVAGPLYAVFAGPTIQQICATLGGPDFWIQPLEPTGATMPSTRLGQINVSAFRGTSRPLAQFEFGMGKKNVASYKRVLTKAGMCNYARALPNGWPNAINAGDHIATSEDTTSENTVTRYDDIVSSDVSDINLRIALCAENVTVRKQRQQQITVTPAPGNVLDYTVDYDVGDIITARAKDTATGTVRFNGLIRLYGVSLTLDDTDKETANLTMITDAVSGGLTYTGTLG
jgi:hypothetical protein